MNFLILINHINQTKILLLLSCSNFSDTFPQPILGSRPWHKVDTITLFWSFFFWNLNMTVRVFPNLESEHFNKFKNNFWILASSPNVCLGNRSGRTCAWNTWMRRVNKKRKNKKKWEKSWKISEVNDVSKNERAFYCTVV